MSATQPSLAADPMAAGGLKKKNLLWIGGITLAVWAFTLQTGSTWLMIVVGVLTLVLAGLLIWALRLLKKQRGLASMLQGATQSTEARREALEKLASDKDANSPTNLFARAQLLAADDPKAALALIESLELKAYPAAMQDDVALLRTQLYLSQGRTQDARKMADTMNLNNPARKEIRTLAVAIVAEAWARTGKSKEAADLLASEKLPDASQEQLRVQFRVANVFARYAQGQRTHAKDELQALANENVNYLGRFLLPQFRVHPDLQKLAKQVMERHPEARKMAKASQSRGQRARR